MKVTYRQIATYPVWTPDGREIAFQLFGTATSNLATTHPDGSVADPSPLVDGEDPIPEDWTPDGAALILVL